MKPLRRNRIGTKSSDLWSWEVEDIKKMSGPLVAQEYIQELIRNDPSNVERIIEKPQQIDLNVWKYEHVRQFVLELNLLVTSLKEVCNSETCPTMKGSPDSEFLCAAHQNPKNCSAIDYMIHNLDQSTSILLNLKNFGTRLSINETKSLDTIVRRLYRVFSHSFNYHGQNFLQFENEMHLCERFTKFTVRHALLDEKLITIAKYLHK